VHLAERGVPVRVLEADALYPGGRLWGGKPHLPALSLADKQRQPERGSEIASETVTLNGLTHIFYPEHGIHGLWNNYVNLRVMLERFRIAPEMMLAQEQEWIHAEAERVWRAEVGSAIHGSLLPPPLHYLNLFARPGFLGLLGARDWLALLAVWQSLLLATALDPFARNIVLPDQTLEDFLGGWSPRLRALFVGLARSGLASPAEKISLTGFIACLRFYTLLRRDALRFAYFLTDCGTALIAPLVEALTTRDSELLLGVTAEQLDHVEGQWRVRGHTRHGPRTFRADQVILAVDAPAAQRLLCASPFTRPVAENLRWPEGVHNGVARLWFSAQPSPGPEGGIFTGDFCMDNFFWLHRLQPEYAQWAKATGGSALEMHLYRSSEFFTRPPAVILAQVILDVYRAFPELKGRVIHTSFQLNAATQTNPRIERAEAWLGTRSPWPNLWICGDWVRGEWPALNIERACVSGLAAANGVLETLGLAPFPVEPYPEPEWLAGKLQQWMWGGRETLRRWRR